MTDFFQIKEYLVREDVGFTKLYESYRIFDSDDEKLLATATEDADLCLKIQKLFLDKALLPMLIKVRSADGKILLELEQPRSLILSTIIARDGEGKILGTFKQTLFSYGGTLEVYGPDGAAAGSICGDWKCRQYTFLDQGGRTLATIDHLYGGLARELLTTADDYRVKVFGDQGLSALVLAGTLAIDMVFHEA